MPTKQVPVFGPRGVATFADGAGATADIPYFLNGYFEKIEASETESRRFAFSKRPGLQLLNAVALANNYKVQGVIESTDRTTIFAYANNGSANKVYAVTASATTDKGSAPAAAGNWTNTGPVVFTRLDGISYGSNAYFVVTDFTKGAIVDASGNWTEITDADFTGLSKCSNFCALDGYIFIATTNNRIYNCDLNTVATWSATSFLTAADTPGAIMWLAKIRNYLIAFKEKSIEFFEDVGNPTPGSPLEPRKSLNRTIGCINRSTIQECSDGIIFAGIAGPGGPKIYKILKDSLQIVPISDRLVEQNLAVAGYTSSTVYSVDSTATGSFSGQSQIFNFDSKEFYAINLGISNITSVYDNDLKVWVNWASAIGSTGTHDSRGFAPSQAVMLNISGAGVYPVFVDNLSSGASSPPRFLFMYEGIYTDLDNDGATQNQYIYAWTSDTFDFGSRHRKFMDSAEILYTIRSNATPSNSSSTTLTFKYRDWDYIDASGNIVSRTAYIDSGSGTRAIMRRLGSFRRRNFNVIVQGTTNFRLWGLEVQLNLGETDQDS
jgi:hypothetical protein